MRLSRRGFAKLCGSAVVAEGLLQAWPLMADVPGANDALTGKTLTEVSGMIRSKSVTSTQLVEALLARIMAINPKVNAYVTVMRTEALAQARVLDEEQKAGKFRGPLHGIPIALKDNIDTAGTRTTAASPMFKDRVPTEDATIVTKLKAAGAIILGKLNLHEFAIGCTGDVSYFGPTRNPWELDRVTGGSSAGSGAAVRSDLCYGALGTDTGGSIRVPSAWCGIVGLKPTVGLVSIKGIIPCAADLDHCGPMARTVEDVALMLGPMAGYDAGDIYSVESQPVDYVKAMKETPIGELRIGTPASFYDHVEPEVNEAIQAALAVLTKMTKGVTSEEPLMEFSLVSRDLGDAAAYHEDLIRKYGLLYMKPDQARFERLMNPPPGSKGPTAADDARARERLAVMRRTIDGVFKDFDVVVVPTIRNMPPKINESLALESAGTEANKKIYDWFNGTSACTNTAPFDVYGIPTISLPCGFSKSGLPIGMMIAAPHFQEGRVLALAYAYQQATEWHKRTPMLTADMPVPPIVEGKPSDGKGGDGKATDEEKK
ncbi:amidase [Granulicella sp. 5B5]|uniref:amidase n=1 Tax=Granulicella sp. 5B5 TaxID=1617967 RepID=UPI0015F67162|nr:amidase [Granulicella sp. 5B5]QMV19625.1 amidase [Granulicella sp. 5B5]